MDVPALSISGEMKAALDAGFAASFGCAPERYFSAPGRTEIGGINAKTKPDTTGVRFFNITLPFLRR